MEAALTQIQGWATELDALITRIAPRFTRGEVRRHVGAFLRGLLVGSTARMVPLLSSCWPVRAVRRWFLVGDEAAVDSI